MSGIVLGLTVVNKTSKVPVTINTFIMSDHIDTMKKIKHSKGMKRDRAGKERGG